MSTADPLVTVISGVGLLIIQVYIKSWGCGHGDWGLGRLRPGLGFRAKIQSKMCGAS